MKFLALVSGGKDSCYAIQQAKENGHELVACLHMARPTNPTEESYMYQTAASEVVRIQVEECLQVPYIQYTRQGTSQHTNLVYFQDETTTTSQSTTTDRKDEVEDLFKAISLALEQFPQIQGVCSGAILSTYQRVRVEHVVCERLHLQSLAFLWRAASQRDILQQMLDSGLDAVLVRTAAPPGILPHKHLNKKLSTLHLAMGLFDKLYERYQFHVCGEGGEYETLCVDSPTFHKRLVLDDVEIEFDDPNDDTVGNLRILACHAEEKEGYCMPERYCSSFSSTTAPSAAPKTKQPNETIQPPPLMVPSAQFLPRTKRARGGLLHLSEITSPVTDSSGQMDEASLAVQEALVVFDILSHILKKHGCTPQDVVMVHLYLSQMSHFGTINKHYHSFFGSLLPPSRSCVAVAMGAGQQRVKLDCIVQQGSGRAMRQSDNGATSQQRRRQVLHVQSRSFWAPVCVGPYSQANTVWGCLHYLAGQIGLDPATMTLKKEPDHGNGNHDWKPQLQQIWTNVAQVLDALDQGTLLTNLLSCLIYIQQDMMTLPDTDGNAASLVVSTTSEMSCTAIANNAGIVPGIVDKGSTAMSNDLDGFEDEETMREVLSAQGKSTHGERDDPPSSHIPPILLVSIVEMPVGARIEVEVVAATQKAIQSLGRVVHPPHTRTIPLFSPAVVDEFWNWDTGYDDVFVDEMNASDKEDENFCFIYSSVCTLGKGCAGYAVVSASVANAPPTSNEKAIVNPDHIMDDIVLVLSESLKDAEQSMDHILHIRLYHLNEHDGPVCEQLRSSLESALGKLRPAVSLVPCFGITILNGNNEEMSKNDNIFVAMQVTLIEPTNLETELWIRSER